MSTLGVLVGALDWEGCETGVCDEVEGNGCLTGELVGSKADLGGTGGLCRREDVGPIEDEPANENILAFGRTRSVELLVAAPFCSPKKIRFIILYYRKSCGSQGFLLFNCFRQQQHSSFLSNRSGMRDTYRCEMQAFLVQMNLHSCLSTPRAKIALCKNCASTHTLAFQTFKRTSLCTAHRRLTVSRM